MELKDIKTFYQSENVDTKTLFQKIMPKLYEYIMDAELAVNPNTPQILVGNNQEYLYFNPQLHPVWRSKLTWSIIPTEKQSVERSVIDRLGKVKPVVISYDFWMSCKAEVNILLTAHYCTGPQRKKPHIGIPSITDTDGVYLYLSVMEVVDNSTLEAKIVGITSDDGSNLWVCREALKSKYTNEYVFHHSSPYSPWIALRIYWKGLVVKNIFIGVF